MVVCAVASRGPCALTPHTPQATEQEALRQTIARSRAALEQEDGNLDVALLSAMNSGWAQPPAQAASQGNNAQLGQQPHDQGQGQGSPVAPAPASGAAQEAQLRDALDASLRSMGHGGNDGGAEHDMLQQAIEESRRGAGAAEDSYLQQALAASLGGAGAATHGVEEEEGEDEMLQRALAESLASRDAESAS